ncbi:hypothetical protein T235_13670 [Tannerella sp. oral taxon BU063 isolate Cell 8/11]|uniref:Dienelactone hydrolase domain-containing protein n=1 Tax=Tannerella sp. oral taxon BU063 isolate Cell 8/11 TaxID=1411915 RepID=W2CXI8_9BACT|nr:hypothetical protein T235_13670 [Tannerella sp. oral taxon BU063 isolate Cell 8/11]
MEHRKVTFHNHFGLTLAADLYLPKGATGKLPAIAVCGLFGGVKEQSSGLYAQTLAERGFITLAFDPSFTGESSGHPRDVFSLDINTEDFQASVDYLCNLDGVDPARVGILGICGWGCIALNAAANDPRIKAVVASTTYDMPRIGAWGYNDSGTADDRYRAKQEIADLRTSEYAAGLTKHAFTTIPVDQLTGKEPAFVRQYSEYYKAPRGYHPRSVNSNLGWMQQAMTVRLDSVKESNAREVYAHSYRRDLNPTVDTSAAHAPAPQPTPETFDSLLAELSPERRSAYIQSARNTIEMIKADNEFQADILASDEKEMRRHHTEMHKKFTLSFACLIFFFIGAPLGAIIRKGGLGMPVVISVFLFIFYYVIDNIGFKMASNGMWQPWQGMWLSSAVLLPLGIFLTYKASNDSAILNADTYTEALKRIIGKRPTRKVERKEVIMYALDYSAWNRRITALQADIMTYLQGARRWMPYFRFWRQGGRDPEAERIARQLEDVVEEGRNSDRHLVLNKLMDYPILSGYDLVDFRMSPRAGHIMAWIFPVSLPIYLLSMIRRKLLLNDLRTTLRVSGEMQTLIPNDNS